MGFEHSARVFFGWDASIYDDILVSATQRANNHHWLLDTQAYRTDGELKNSYAFDATSGAAFEHLGVCRMFNLDEIIDILAHKAFFINSGGFHAAPLELPNRSQVEKMTAELKTDMISLGLDIDITETLGEPKFLVVAGRMTEEFDDG